VEKCWCKPISRRPDQDPCCQCGSGGEPNQCGSRETIHSFFRALIQTKDLFFSILGFVQRFCLVVCFLLPLFLLGFCLVLENPSKCLVFFRLFKFYIKIKLIYYSFSILKLLLISIDEQIQWPDKKICQTAFQI